MQGAKFVCPMGALGAPLPLLLGCGLGAPVHLVALVVGPRQLKLKLKLQRLRVLCRQ